MFFSRRWGSLPPVSSHEHGKRSSRWVVKAQLFFHQHCLSKDFIFVKVAICVLFALTLIMWIIYGAERVTTKPFEFSKEQRKAQQMLFRQPLARRGIVLCLHEKYVDMGLSLLKELACLDYADVPVQVYYCMPEELSDASRRLLVDVHPDLTLVDVCTKMIEANQLTVEMARSFQSYWIKPLALVDTSFEEVMIVDADDLFMHSPETLWKTTEYERTGTLFFYDRVMNSKNFLLQSTVETMYRKNPSLPLIQTSMRDGNIHFVHYIVHYGFDRRQYQYDEGIVEVDGFYRSPNSVPSPVDSKLRKYLPSLFLEKSLVWKDLTAHHQDSSILLFHKGRQSRAIRIMWELITKWRFMYHFTHGDKEVFWLSCELAGSAYAFSPWAVGVAEGWEDATYYPDQLCGALVQYAPYNIPFQATSVSSSILYINGRTLLLPHPTGTSIATVSTINLFELFQNRPERVTSRAEQHFYPKMQRGECVTTSSMVSFVSFDSRFYERLSRRRSHLMSFALGSSFALDLCEDHHKTATSTS